MPVNTLEMSKLDQEHVYLDGLVSEMNEILKQPVKREDLVFKIAEIYYFCHKHFRREEAFLGEGAWGGLSDHAKLHKDMALTLNSLYAKVLSVSTETEALEAAKDVHSFLSNWLVKHINTEDSQYVEYFDHAA